MKLSIVVPYRPDGGHRDQAWAWVRDRYLASFPGVEIVEADDGIGADDLFSHAVAINRGVETATGDLLLIADADTGFNAGELWRAKESIEADGGWRLPRRYITCSEWWSAHLLASVAVDEDLPAYHPLDGVLWLGDAVSWAGLVMIPREGFERVGGYEPRHIGWGSDDCAFGLSVDTLWSPHQRFDGSAFHFWHPRGVQEEGGHRNSHRQRELTERYQAAAGDRSAMQGLIDEREGR